MQDHALIRQAQAGDDLALAELLKHKTALLVQQFHVQIPARHAGKLDIDDILQISFLAAFLKIKTYDPAKASFGAWLATIAKHNLIDAIRGLDTLERGGKTHHVAATRPDGDDFLDQLAAQMTTPTKAFARAEFLDKVQEALASLPEVYREVFTLRHLNNLPADEIALRLQCSPGAVFMRLARAREALQELLGSASHYGLS